MDMYDIHEYPSIFMDAHEHRLHSSNFCNNETKEQTSDHDVSTQRKTLEPTTVTTTKCALIEENEYGGNTAVSHHTKEQMLTYLISSTTETNKKEKVCITCNSETFICSLLDLRLLSIM